MPANSDRLYDRIHHPRYAGDLITFAVLFAIAFFFLFEPWGGYGFDQIFYTGHIASLVLDGDLDMVNDHLLSYNSVPINEIGTQFLTKEGYMADFFAVGPSLLMAPFWFAAYGIDRVFFHTVEVNRFGLLYRIATSFACAFYGFLGLLLVWRVACRFVSARIAFVSAFLTFFGSIILVYCFQMTDFSHPFSFFATALFLYIVIDYSPYRRWRDAVYLGLAAGLMVVTRWQTVLFVFLPLVPLRWPHTFDPWHPPVTPAEPEAEEEGPIPFETSVPPPVPNTPADSPESRVEELIPPISPAIESRVYLRFGGLTWPGIVCRFLLFVAAFAILISPQCLIWKKIFGSWIVAPQAQSVALWPEHFFQGLSIKWKEVLFSGWCGLYHWNPLLIASTGGLFLMAVRRRTLGVSLLVCGAAMTVVNAMPADWAGGGGVGPRRFCVLLPFFTLGTAYFLQFMRRRPYRWLAIAGLTVLVAWNVVVIIAAMRTMVRISPLSGTVATWGVLFSEILRHPLAYFDNSLLLRYLSQGPAPLEPTLSLLLLTLFFPLAIWVGVRYFLPAARRWYVLKILALLGVICVLVYDSAVWKSDCAQREGNIEVRQATMQTAPTTQPTTLQAQTLADRLDLILGGYPDNLAGRIRLAGLSRKLGNVEKARSIYRSLALQSYYTGWIALFDTARSLDEKHEAIDVLAKGEPGLPMTTIDMTRAFIAAGEEDRAREWLDASFIGPGAYWSLRAELAKDDPDLALDFLRRSVIYDPVSPYAIKALWEQLRRTGHNDEAAELLDRLETVGTEQMNVYEKAAERYSRETFVTYFGYVRPYALVLAEIYEQLGDRRKAASAWNRAAYFSLETVDADWAKGRALEMLQPPKPARPAATDNTTTRSLNADVPTSPPAPQPSK